jgi:hypothetical protein
MKELLSLLVILGLMAIAFVGLHYLILFLGLNDISALILFAMPVVAMIAYSSHDTLPEMMRSAGTIFISFISVILAASGLVWFIG